MKKVFIITVLAGFGLLFIYLGCNLGIEGTPKGVSYSASTIFSVQALDTSKTGGNISIVYEFPPTLTQTRVIIRRTDAVTSDTLTIERGKPLVYNDLDTLIPDKGYSYALALLNGGPTPYDTVKAKTLPVVDIISPVDTVTGDMLDIAWYPISQGQTKFLDYKVELFKSGTNPDSVLNYLTNPVWSTNVTLSASDTVGRVSFARGSLVVNQPFTVRVTATKVVQLLTDTSVGNRVFLWFLLTERKK